MLKNLVLALLLVVLAVPNLPAAEGGATWADITSPNWNIRLPERNFPWWSQYNAADRTNYTTPAGSLWRTNDAPLPAGAYRKETTLQHDGHVWVELSPFDHYLYTQDLVAKSTSSASALGICTVTIPPNYPLGAYLVTASANLTWTAADPMTDYPQLSLRRQRGPAAKVTIMSINPVAPTTCTIQRNYPAFLRSVVTVDSTTVAWAFDLTYASVGGTHTLTADDLLIDVVRVGK